ncbi:helicase [Xanthomonas phage L522]|nr:helicase [Xanthomonas phage L522]
MTEHTTSLLRLGLQRQQHQNLYEVVPAESLDQYSLLIWKAQARYYREHPDAQDITDLDAWQTWLDMTVLANKDNDTKVLIGALVKGLGGPVDQILAGTLAHVYLQQALSLDTLKAIEAWNNESNTQDLDQLIAAATEKYKGRLTKVEADPVESSGLDDLFGREEADAGFHWRLKHLQESMRPLRPGDSIIWAARPDQGKTSSVASEVSQMITQLDQVFPGEKKSFLWLNNEGDTKNIRRRLYQAALGITYSQMLDLHEQGKLEPALHQALGGKDLFDRALVLSVHQYTTTDILKLIRKHNAGLVVFDMLDNVKFTGSKINGGERTDEVLEELYRWVRDYASIEGYAAINTSQISAAGEGLAAPDMSMLKDSKTAKAGACEAIVMWGSTKDKPNSRFLGIPKNKLRLEGRRMNPNAECYFAPDICRVMTLEEAAKLYES